MIWLGTPACLSFCLAKLILSPWGYLPLICHLLHCVFTVGFVCILSLPPSHFLFWAMDLSLIHSHSLNPSSHPCLWISGCPTLIEKKIKFSLYIRKFRMEQLQSHIWLTASSYMGKYIFAYFLLYFRKPFLIYDFTTAPHWISLYMRKILFSFLESAYCLILNSTSCLFSHLPVLLLFSHPLSFSLFYFRFFSACPSALL